jgi:hypothetical protein
MKRYARLVLVLLGMLSLMAVRAGAQGPPPSTAAETWVLQQVAAGLTADLEERFGEDPKGRTLRGRFLEALLTGELPGFKPHRHGVSIKNAVIADYLDLRSAAVAQAVELHACRFQVGLDGSYSHFKKALSLDKSEVVGWANFNGLKVDSDASFNDTAFHNGLFMQGAEVAGRFSAQGARFTHQDLGAMWANLQVGSDLDLMNAAFQGHAFFSRIRVKGNFSIFKASFSRSVFFDGAEISGDFTAMEARFQEKTAPAYFTNLKVGGRGFFSNLTAPGGVSMAMARFLDLFLGAITGLQHYQILNLDYAVVDRLLDLRHVELGNLEAKKFLGKDLVYLDNVQIKDETRLEGANFQTLVLIKVAWPPKPDRVWLDEMTYQAITARDKPEEEKPSDWLKLLALVNLSRFNTQNYTQLQAYFQRRGEMDRADAVYIAGKRREAMQKWWRPDNLATLIFWDGLAGYGRKPGRTFWISLFIVLVGTLFFDHRNFDPSFVGGWKWLLNGSRGKTGVVRFFLSLDEFLPGVDLGLAKLWQMNRVSFPILMYYHFHKIAGWILIPIGLAAVYTQFK